MKIKFYSMIPGIGEYGTVSTSYPVETVGDKPEEGMILTFGTVQSCLKIVSHLDENGPAIFWQEIGDLGQQTEVVRALE